MGVIAVARQYWKSYHARLSFFQLILPIAFRLSPNTTYYFRAVVENSNGKAYGDILNFRMNSSYIPPVIPPEGAGESTRCVNHQNARESHTSNGTDTSSSALRGHTVRFTIKAGRNGDYIACQHEHQRPYSYYLEFANATESLRTTTRKRSSVVHRRPSTQRVPHSNTRRHHHRRRASWAPSSPT